MAPEFDFIVSQNAELYCWTFKLWVLSYKAQMTGVDLHFYSLVMLLTGVMIVVYFDRRIGAV